MTYETGHFYRDADGDVWQAVTESILMHVAAGDSDPDVIPFDVVPAESVERRHGPVLEVRPAGWVPVEEHTVHVAFTSPGAAVRPGADWAAIGGGLEARTLLTDPVGTIHLRYAGEAV
ncbi:hypothetical protein [Streptomyces sp. NPDC002491]